MLGYALRRIVPAGFLVLVISLFAFTLVFAAGDPSIKLAGESGTAADAARIREQMGFDRPIAIQYLDWLAAILRGNLGYSLYFDQPVATIIAERAKDTLKLAVSGILVAIGIALPLGIAAARWRDTVVDRAILIFTVVGQAMPTFWFALLLIIAFSVHWQILPTSGSATWLHFVMPALSLGYYAAPAILRLTRAGMIDTLDTDFIRTSRAMGVGGTRILFTYALRNAIMPVVGVAAAQFGAMLAGSIVVESIFALNGVGRLAYESIRRSDLPMVQALILCFSAVYILLTILADLLNAWIDPRVRMGDGRRE